MLDAEGASNNERLLAAARTDNEELLMEVLGDEGTFDINFQDGLGNTALHYAASHGSMSVLEHILSHEDCDVDPINRLERATPLHLAITTIEDPDLRAEVVESLLEAGADIHIKDKNGDTPSDYIPKDDDRLLSAFKKAQVETSITLADVASDDDEDDDEGSGSD